MSGYAKLSASLIGAWFIVSLIAAGRHVYQTAPNQPPLLFGLAVLLPVLVFAAWFALSASFRDFALSLNPRILTSIQSWRVAGFVFLALTAYGILPRSFALSAGLGDMAIGATALLVALKLATPEHRASFIVWQVLGIADLVTAIALGTVTGIIDPHGIPTSAMTVLPMSLIPTFAVPIFFMLHIICISQAMRWRKLAAPPIGQQSFSAAV
jgi:hypothetical protein